MKSTQEKTMEWETKVWTWITKEMPNKHSDRFAPLFKIIDEIRQETYEQGYQISRDRYRQREALITNLEDKKKKITYILSRLSKEADVSVCSECGELMVCPVGFDMNPICSKVECNYKFLKNNG